MHFWFCYQFVKIGVKLLYENYEVEDRILTDGVKPTFRLEIPIVGAHNGPELGVRSEILLVGAHMGPKLGARSHSSEILQVGAQIGPEL